ncbi:flagellar biosynthetic protein FliR [Thermodesulfobacteriota bacterium]
MPFPVESLEQMQGFFWILMRISILFALLPIIGGRGIPPMWKAGVSFILAIVLTPMVPPIENIPETIPEIILGLLSELILGFILAFSARLLITSVQMAGQYMSFQMGFAMARAMDPQTGTSSTILTQFLHMLTILIFFSINGHHIFIKALANSFQIIPPNGVYFNPTIIDVFISLSGYMFLMGLKIAAPIMVALFLSNLSLGIVARTVPQVNILMIGFPINICIGLVLFSLLLLDFSPVVTELVRTMGEVSMKLINLMK